MPDPFVNPYNFVRSGPTLPSLAPQPQHRLSGLSGTLQCSLKNLTPIFTPAGGRDATKFFRVGGKLALPGSSLKGMIRSVAEALSNSCGPFGKPRPRCSLDQGLCLSCRLFGYLNAGNVYSGLVSVTDAQADGEYTPAPVITLRRMNQPNPNHDPFYQDARSQQGRKFFYHQSHVVEIGDIPKGGGNAAPKVEPLPSNARFTFEVRYRHLNHVELGLLVYALQFDSGFYHKLGRGKPLGMGTVRIDITGLRELPEDPRQRYEEFDQPWSEIDLAGLSGDAYQQANMRLQARLNDFRKPFTAEYARALGQPVPLSLWRLTADNLDDLKIILSPVPYSRDIRYPSDKWFNSTRKSHKLPSIQNIHRDRITKTCWLPDP